jgi:S-adenosylmethionine:tRNA ribosyltransferase-isomerase
LDASALDFDLPQELIAEAPTADRDGARLLVARARRGAVADAAVRDLPSLLPPRSLLVVNDTRVIPARLQARRATGGRIEVLLVERADGDLSSSSGPSSGVPERWRALVRGLGGLRAGETLSVDDASGPALDVTLVSRADDGLADLDVRARDGGTVRGALERVGTLPLPPYIRRAPDERDRERYQTIFAAREGSVAAPTAGLHFSEALVHALRAAGHELARVTLHVGPGTFAPLRAERLEAHSMHAERYEIPGPTALAVARARAEGRSVVAIGTTVTRTLEAAATADRTVREGAGVTDLFLYPPYRFRVVDVLFTNFHLPRSTLLALVMAFAGVEPTRDAYAHAVRERYRFFSYGDASLWLPEEGG